jgi:competence protein ComK
MVGHYDRNGKLCSFVRELNRELIVDRSPLEILADTIKCMGFDLRGAIATAKLILGEIPMCPLVVNPIHNICVFSTKSAKNEEAMWFNPIHIVRTHGFYFKTKVVLRDGRTITVPSKVSSFNTKLQNADQLRKITEEIGNDPISFLLEPKRFQLRCS